MTASLIDRPRARTVPDRERRPATILAVLLLAQFMAILDLSVVNVAVPTIRTDLDASGAALQLVVGGYTLSYAMLLITGARLGDRLGHARVFRGGLALFTLASLACGLAPTSSALVISRVVQGIGAAAMMPQVMSLIQRTFSGGARARALSLYSAVIACGAVVGQVAGGLLVSADVLGLGWRPVFDVNVPIGILLLVLSRRFLPRSEPQPDRGLDPLGVVIGSLAVLLLVLPLVLGHEERWPAWTWASLAASPVAFLALAVVERRVGRRGGSPLVSGAVLRAPGLLSGLGALFLAMSVYGGFLFSFALHLQSGLGDSAARAGLVFLPMSVGFAATSLTWSRLSAPAQRRLVPSGLALSAVCFVGLASLLHDARTVDVTVWAVLFALGLVLGAAFGPMLTITLAHVPPRDAADASGVMVTVFQIGQVVGVATLGTLYLSLVHGPGAAASGGAFSTTGLCLAGASLAAAGFAATLLRRRRAG